jgi:hypothetical protein
MWAVEPTRESGKVVNSEDLLKGEPYKMMWLLPLNHSLWFKTPKLAHQSARLGMDTLLISSLSRCHLYPRKIRTKRTIPKCYLTPSLDPNNSSSITRHFNGKWWCGIKWPSKEPHLTKNRDSDRIPTIVPQNQIFRLICKVVWFPLTNNTSVHHSSSCHH